MNKEIKYTRISQTDPDLVIGKRLRQTLAVSAALVTICVTTVAIQASEQTTQTGESGGWTVSSLVWILSFPAIAMVIYSLIVNRRKGWGWVVVGTAIVAILLLLQFIWSIITAFRGDPGDDEDYFKPLDNWTSDSF